MKPDFLPHFVSIEVAPGIEVRDAFEILARIDSLVLGRERQLAVRGRGIVGRQRLLASRVTGYRSLIVVLKDQNEMQREKLN